MCACVGGMEFVTVRWPCRPEPGIGHGAGVAGLCELLFGAGN